MIEKLEYNSNRTSIDGIHWEWRPNLKDVIDKINEIIDAVNVSTVDAESTKQGHWEWDGYIYDAPWQCSECGSFNEYDSNYCPDCGAKMGGKPIPNINIITNKATTVINDGNAMSTETKERNNIPRCIDADEILKSEHQHYDYMADEYYVLVRDIENAPTIDTEPKQAYVIVDEDGNMECSNCGSSFCFDNYCAHCGAKLMGERKAEAKYE